MTLEEAIAHAQERGQGTDACAADHWQLSQWLRELAAFRQSRSSKKLPDRDPAPWNDPRRFWCDECASAQGVDRAVEAVLREERAAVVAWLRTQVNCFSNRHAQDLADKIESGAHRCASPGER